MLGSATATRAGVAPKAATLDRAAAAGLRVPDGFVIPDGAAVNDAMRDRAAALGAVAVRSAFGAEDGTATSLAGHFHTELGITPARLDAAVAGVRASADRHDGVFRRDVLVMSMVPAEHAGVAFSEPGTYDDIINVVTGLADGLVSGTTAGERVDVPRVEPADPGWPTRLQRLLAATRRVFGDQPWDIEWADDGTDCWLLQIRPITAAPLRPEQLTLANHAEIFPDLPSTLMTSVVEAAGPDLFEWYRRRVPGLPADRDFLYVKAGRPMINLTLLEDMLRHLGLPTALVADSIGGPPADSRPARPGRILTQLPSLARLGVSQIVAVATAARRRRRLAAIGATGAGSFGEALHQLHEAYVGLVTGMFPLSSSIGPPLSILRRVGTLYEHAARHRTITFELAQAIDEVRRSTDPAVAERFVERFGHRGVYESDIARPRYRDQLPPAAADHSPRPVPDVPPRTLLGWLTLPVWGLAAPPMRARELLRHDAMRAFDHIRRSLVALADEAVAGGLLPAVDDLWLLTVHEVRAIDRGIAVDPALIADRRAERKRLAAIDVPHVVGRHDDPAEWGGGTSSAAGRQTTDQLRGIPLTSGTVTGTAWVLHEPADTLPDGYDHDSTVLVARSIDAGWVSTLGLVAAAVIEIGGDLSHGSILVREAGLPAVTNVTDATRRIAAGQQIRVAAATGTVTTV